MLKVSAFVAHPNRLNRKLQASSPNQVFVTDMTYKASMSAGLG